MRVVGVQNLVKIACLSSSPRSPSSLKVPRSQQEWSLMKWKLSAVNRLRENNLIHFRNFSSSEITGERVILPWAEPPYTILAAGVGRRKEGCFLSGGYCELCAILGAVSDISGGFDITPIASYKGNRLFFNLLNKELCFILQRKRKNDPWFLLFLIA